ncbi:MAG: tRNA-binding protein [Bacteroidetes bacterium HGW-Bacteroidetes-2]|jgi:tRNA-binding protein|nr:MAG: tRNA-binding protein [Bacteroidetes bacterium HGW-Bacteroidetes-2]
MEIIDWQHFQQVQMQVGTIITAEDFPEAKQPAYKLQIDFGPELGVKKSSAQITKRYRSEELIGKQIIAVVNFPPKQIANVMSECLVLGAVDASGDVILLQPEAKVANGLRIA